MQDVLAYHDRIERPRPFEAVLRRGAGRRWRRPGDRRRSRPALLSHLGRRATKPIDGEAATHANGGTIGFACVSPAQADAWHAAGLANGGTTCEDPPGVREGALGKLYLAYLRDPDGNKLCGLHRMG